MFLLVFNSVFVRKVKGGPALVRNCWLLLESTDNDKQMEKLFQFLTANGYCQVSNIILGPLVKLHIKKDNLPKAVEVFKNCVNQYNFTPQQLELLSQVVRVQDKKLTEEVHNCLLKVHGPESAAVSLMAALALNGYIKSLRKILLVCKFYSIGNFK